MKKLRKAAILAALAFVAAASLLLIKPVRVWASIEGDYVYHLFVLRGPAYLYKSTVGGIQGIQISTAVYTGASQSGVPAANGTPLWLVGGQTSAQRTSCAAAIEGQFIYDPTVHSVAFCDGTVWHKLVTGVAANDSWTTY